MAAPGLEAAGEYCTSIRQAAEKQGSRRRRRKGERVKKVGARHVGGKKGDYGYRRRNNGQVVVCLIRGS